MQEQVALQNLLRKKLMELQARNPSYSVRAFAQKLGLQPAATNEILKGERRASLKLAEKIASKLHLDPSERNELLKHFPKKQTRKQDLGGVAQGELLKLSTDQFNAMSEWVHYAILSLIKTTDCDFKPATMAERLGVSEKKIQECLERLFRLKLIEQKEDGTLARTVQRIHTTDDVQSVSIQKSHLADMDLARDALLSVPVELRDFTSFTMPVSPKLLPKAKEIIRRAQDEVADLLKQESPTEVYRMTSYLFPLTKSDFKKEKSK